MRQAFRMNITGRDGSLYLVRYTLLQTRWGSLRFHIFHRSDEDRELHDHPWPFTSLILWGGYWEITPHMPDGEDRTWYGPGSVLRRPATWRHRVELAACSTHYYKAYTLIWTGPVERKWGFWTRCGWQYWRTFLDKKFNGVPICGDDT